LRLPGIALEKLHLHRQTMARLRFSWRCRRCPRALLLIHRQTPHAMLDQEAVHRRAGHGDVVTAPQIVGAPTGAEVLLLAQIQNLAHNL